MGGIDLSLAEKKNDWFWSEGALDKWERLDEDIRRLILKNVEVILKKNPQKDTISEKDMEEIIKEVLSELNKNAWIFRPPA